MNDWFKTDLGRIFIVSQISLEILRLLQASEVLSDFWCLHTLNVNGYFIMNCSYREGFI